MSRTVKLTVKWGKEKYSDIVADLAQPPRALKDHLCTLTGVPSDRQKVMIPKAGLLKDDDWGKADLKDGAVLTLIGSAEVVVRPEGAPTVFAEDIAPVAVTTLAAGQVEGVSGFRPGLKNLGNTCYMNATVQVLARAVPELDTQTLAAGGPGVAAALAELQGELHNGTTTVIPLRFLMELRRAFPRFAETDEPPANCASGKCASCGGPRQQDAEECWSAVMSTLGPRAQSLFEGELVSRATCPEAPQEPERTERSTFRKLECRIDSSTSFLIEGLQRSMTDEREQNAQTLGRQAVFTVKSAIARLPSYLTVHFVRFCWKKANVIAGNFKGGKAKIVKPVNFPAVLDVLTLCDGPLKDRLSRARSVDRAAEDAAAGLTPIGKPDATMAAPEGEVASLGRDTGLYELDGVVSHQGMYAEGGHYVAWLREGPGRWLKYDDEKVSLVGDAEVGKLDGRGGGDWHIAYMLLYRQRTREGQPEPKPAAAPAADAVPVQPPAPFTFDGAAAPGSGCGGCSGSSCGSCPSQNPPRAPH